MSNVIDLPVLTCLDIPVEKICDKAKAAIPEHVVIVGWDNDGDFYFASSKSDGAECLWLLEIAKKK